MSRNFGIKRHEYQPVSLRMRFDDAMRGRLVRLAIVAVTLGAVFLLFTLSAHADTDQNPNYSQTGAVRSPAVRVSHARRHVRSSRAAPVLDANGNAAGIVRASNGLRVRVASSAQATLQCVVDHVEAAGVHITALGGIRAGRCSSRSMHPCGKAIDINQTARDINGPPRAVSNAAALACNAVSGSWWTGNPDNGHFQVGGWAGNHGQGTTYAARRHHRRHRVAMR